MKYEEIKHLRVSDLSETDRKIWVMDEITELTNDMGTSIDDEMLRHTSKRLLDKLNTAYRSWFVADVHAAFQQGLSGVYGSFRKVTVQAMFHFLKMAQNQMSNTKAMQAENESDFKSRVTYVEGITSEFLAWASGKMICLEFLSPGYEPLKHRRVSPEVEEMAEEYRQAKEMNVLESFANRLRNQMEAYNEKMLQHA